MPAARGRKRKASSDEDETSESSESFSEEESSEESEEELDDSDEDDEPKRKRGARGKAKPALKKKPVAKRGAAPVKKRGRKAKEESSGEEEEVMQEEEEEELDDEPDEHDPGYGPTLIKDEADQAYLNSLDERQRELVLAERFDRLQRYEEWKRLRAERANNQSAQKAAGKRKAAQPKHAGVQIESDDEDTSPKAPSYAQQQSAQQKSAPVPREEDEVSQGDDPEEIIKSKEPEESDEEDEVLQDADRTVTYESIARIVVTRANILEWINYPSKRFKKGLSGCFVKVTDSNLSSGERYELRMVTSIIIASDDDAYEVDRDVVTIYFKVQGGAKNNTKRVPLTRISNKPLTQEEFAVYSTEPLLRSMTLRNARHIRNSLKSKLIDYVLGPVEALAVVSARQARRGKASNLENAAGLTLVARKSALASAISECNQGRLRLRKDLMDLEEKVPGEDEDEDDFEEHKSEMRDKILSELRKVNDRVSKLEAELAKVETLITQDAYKRMHNEVTMTLNEQNERMNRETIERVEQQRLAQQASNQGQNLNPFLRRPTRPLMMWDTGGSAPEKAKEGASSTEAGNSNGSANNGATTSSTQTTSAPSAPSEHAPVPLLSVPAEVTEEVDVQPSQAKLKIQADASIITSTATKKFSLADYKKMKQQQQRL